MPLLTTQLNARSAEFQANAAAMQALVDDLNRHTAQVALGGGEAARAKHTARGKLLPRERVQLLLDPGTPFRTRSLGSFRLVQQRCAKRRFDSWHWAGQRRGLHGGVQ